MIRSILYLDEQKLFSFSSQVLQGLTEYLTREHASEIEDSEEQKGPIASGRALASALSKKDTSFEKRVLHDHAFAVFEEKLVESGAVLDVAGIEDESKLSEAVSTASLVRIRAPARFVDAAKLASLLSGFNKLGEALAYTTSQSEISAAVDALEQLKAGHKPKSPQYTEIERRIKDARDPSLIARSRGLYQDPTFLESLRLVTEFG